MRLMQIKPSPSEMISVRNQSSSIRINAGLDVHLFALLPDALGSQEAPSFLIVPKLAVICCPHAQAKNSEWLFRFVNWATT